MEESNIPPLKKKLYISVAEASEKNPGQTQNILKIKWSLQKTCVFGFMLLISPYPLRCSLFLLFHVFDMFDFVFEVI